MSLTQALRRLREHTPDLEPVEPVGGSAGFPHCDQRVLHAPGECEYCDLHPEWQELRVAWGIAFTGHEPERSADSFTEQLPCPADYNRPPGSPSDHRKWAGNVSTCDREPIGVDARGRLVTGTDLSVS